MTVCGRLSYGDLGSSPRNSLQMVYADLCVTRTSASEPMEIFPSVAVLSPMSILEWVSVVHTSV